MVARSLPYHTTAVVITGARVIRSLYVFRVQKEFKRIITMIVQNSMLVGEVFQIEVSDGLVHPLEVVKM